MSAKREHSGAFVPSLSLDSEVVSKNLEKNIESARVGNLSFHILHSTFLKFREEH